MSSQHYLPAEWHQQEFVQLTWPHPATDWAPILNETYTCFLDIAWHIAMRQPLLVVAQHPQAVERQIQDYLDSRQKARPPYPIHVIACPNNDTWARDHAFISVLTRDGRRLLYDYAFNGWGKKFPSNLDNKINKSTFSFLNQLFKESEYIDRLDFVLEGGSIESDGAGTLMTTTSCLLSPERNPQFTQTEIEQRLKSDTGASQVLWLHHGHLEGDDTDGHIDTLARFCPDNTIVYVACNDPADPHFEDLQRMEAELLTFHNAQGQPYRLVSLPHPRPMYDDEGQPMPATYANFLYINGALLVPTYRQPDIDQLAVTVLQTLHPHHQVVPIDCSVLIRQHGSLHCSTMQFPSPL